MQQPLARPLPPSQNGQVVLTKTKSTPVAELSNPTSATHDIRAKMKEERIRLAADIAQRQAAIALLRDEALKNGSREQYRAANDMESKLQEYIQQKKHELNYQFQAYRVRSGQ